MDNCLGLWGPYKWSCNPQKVFTDPDWSVVFDDRNPSLHEIAFCIMQTVFGSFEILSSRPNAAGANPGFMRLWQTLRTRRAFYCRHAE